MGTVINFPGMDKPYAEMTPLERAQAQIKILIAYLDDTDPDWRRKIRERMDDDD